MSKTGSVMALIFFSVLIFCSIISVHGVVTFTPETQFAMPEKDGGFNFAIGGSYNYSSLEDGIWYFAGLALDSYVVDFGGTYPYGILHGSELVSYLHNHGNFSVSLQNCDITITNYDLITQWGPEYENGWLNYTVSGVGNQTFNLYFRDRISWAVYINGVAKPENDGWTISQSSTDEWITVTGATSNVSIYYARPAPEERKDPIQSDLERGLYVVALISIVIIIFLALSALYDKRKQNTPHSLSEKKIGQEKH